MVWDLIRPFEGTRRLLVDDPPKWCEGVLVRGVGHALLFRSSETGDNRRDLLESPRCHFFNEKV